MQKTTSLPAFLLLCLVLATAASAAQNQGALSYSDGQLIVASEEHNSLFASNDAGTRWRTIEPPRDAIVYDLFPSPDGRAWMATNHGLYQSDRDLADWDLVFQRPAAWVVCSPNGQHCLFKVWGQGLHHVVQQPLPPDAPALQAARIPLPANTPPQSALVTDSNQLIAGFFGRGVFRSADSGASWETLHEGLPGRQILLLAMAPDAMLYAGLFGGGLWVREPQGSSWQLRDPLFFGSIVQTIDFGPDDTIVVGTREHGLITSEDSGRTWAVSGGLPGPNVLGAAVTTTGAWWCYLRDHGLFFSADRGAQWTRRPYAHLNRVQQVAIDAQGHWYAAVTGLGLMASRDAGATWKTLSLPAPWNPAMIFGTTASKGLFLTHRASLWFSPDGGEIWEEEEPFWGTGDISFMGTGPDDTMYLIINEAGGFYTRRPHEAWQQVTAESCWRDSYHVRDILFTPEQVVAFGAYDCLQSGDGESWEITRFGQSNRCFYMTGDGILNTERHLSTFRWDDDGSAWQPGSAVADDHRFTMLVTFADGSAVAAGPTSGVRPVQTDGTYGSQPTLAIGTLLDLASDQDRQLLAGTSQGLWHSSDQGNHWTRNDMGF